MNTIDTILLLMQSDDDDREEQSEMLEKTYAAADDTGKKLVDDCFIALCGFSLRTIVDNPEDIEPYLRDRTTVKEEADDAVVL